MPRAIALRCDFGAVSLRRLARRSKEAAQARRLLALAAQIGRGPIPALHGVVRWRLVDLGQWLWPNFNSRSEQNSNSCD